MTVDYQVVIGLEVHVQLRTVSKLFCGCAVKFAAPPNSLTCPVCCGFPGALPVLNEQAVELAICAGLGLHCEIANTTHWDRKHYFYPDLPKGYQISQLDRPLCGRGYLEVPAETDQSAGRRIAIIRAHVEEDAGKSLHGRSADGQPVSYIDLNRAGTPLFEIVTAPDLRGSDETRRFLVELRLLLLALDVSDCNMQEGSLRVDANVNLHLQHAGRHIETPIVEMKNLNSFRAVQRAIDHEADRLLRTWQAEGIERQSGNKQTRGWDDERGRSYVLRDKEELEDYRYFPDPDIPPLEIDAEWVAAIRRRLARSPAELRRALMGQYGLSRYDADVLVAQGRGAAEFFESVVAAGGPSKAAANIVLGDIANTLNEQQWTIADYPVSPNDVGRLLAMVDRGELTQALARDWLRTMHREFRTLDEVLSAGAIVAVGIEELDRVCRQLIAEHPQAVEAFRQGKVAALGPLIGRLRRILPNANPQAALDHLKSLLK
ncbi:MAG TPA: Asp-tRNA(Asn)/Glu-tRNA(Gln) amidotransferase subunit GatB [Pirellulaceae bacterium]|nr:Asp-tRNA(Asn)/Glu-tRNA(Gln) amidotransferase subunit GatB [Pirellulaceae bacterium]